jgi:tetratricopeptide (TPR) repeat protein/predicted aspartyl protease
MCPSTPAGAAPQARGRLRTVVSAAAALAGLALLVAGPASAEPCKLERMHQLPVTMQDMQPLVHAAINGTDALFVADSGSFFNTLTPAGARQLNLQLEPADGLYVSGTGGAARTWITTVKSFRILGRDVPRVVFIVAGNDLGGGAVGVLGQNVFRLGDVEYDLANGVINILRTHGDCQQESLAYWANARGLPVSAIDIDFPTAESPHTMGTAYLNGRKIRVMFDTGAATSTLSLDAAERAGVTKETPGVTPAGKSYGFGRHEVPTWIGPFASFRIGDEEIRNTRLEFADMGQRDVDMLVGADFFLSHHILVASSQHTLYFTYNGGPVFNLTGRTPAPAPAGSTALDAAGYARRGSASASRRDYEQALADLSRAIELDPTQADYFYERGSAYDADKQPARALADFTQAIKVKPDHVPALLARAALREQRRDPAEAIGADLDAADRAAPGAADMRLDLGELYLGVRNYAAAIAQYDRWIEAHNRDDVHMPRARGARCWARALAGQQLDRALEDCNAAVRATPKTADFLDSRGLVYLRRGQYDKAIADYGAALALDPKLAWSLYGRGLAKQHLGQAAAGEADIAAAAALFPKIAEVAAGHGIGP